MDERAGGRGCSTQPELRELSEDGGRVIVAGAPDVPSVNHASDKKPVPGEAILLHELKGLLSLHKIEPHSVEREAADLTPGVPYIAEIGLQDDLRAPFSLKDNVVEPLEERPVLFGEVTHERGLLEGDVLGKVSGKARED